MIAFIGRDIREEEGLEENRQAAFEDVAGTVDPNLVLTVIQADLQENGVNSYLLGPDQQFHRWLSTRRERNRKHMRQFRKVSVLLRFY